MKKKLYHYIFYLMILLLNSWQVYGLCITRLFYHQGIMSDRIVCYFDQRPVINEQGPKEKKVKDQLVLIIPAQLVLNNELDQMLSKLKNLKQDGYSVSLEKVTVPVTGIKIAIQYNPQKIVCDYASCESIAQQKSLVISLYKKNVLDVLRQNTDSVLKQVQNVHNPYKIVIDCGHGGQDNGKIGINAAKEKDVNLSIGTQVAGLLKKRGYEVNLTRNRDQDVPLDFRTTHSNKLHADLFLSIHSNGATRKEVCGIETIWSGIAHLVKKKTMHKQLIELLEKRDKASKLFAQQLHKNILATAGKFYEPYDRRVKESPFQVLIGTEMPAALVEVGFLSNQQEAQFLIDPLYQKALAEGICKGIDDYFKGCIPL